MSEEESIAISILDGHVTMGMLFYPFAEEIEQLGRIRLGEELVRETNEYLTELWDKSKVGVPASIDRYRERGIVGTMDADFNGYLTDVKTVRVRTIIRDNIRKRLSQSSSRKIEELTEEEHKSLVEKALVEEQERLNGVLKGYEAFARTTGDAGYFGYVIRLGKYLNASAFFNLYLTAYCLEINGMIEELYSAEPSSEKDRIQRRVNSAIPPLFLEIVGNSISFNPMGLFGSGSYWDLPQSIAETISRYDMPVFTHPDSEDSDLLLEAAEFHYYGNFYVPDKISLDDFMGQNFGDERISHYPDYGANIPGAVLLVKRIGEHYRDMIVVDRDVPNRRMLSGNLLTIEEPKR